MKMSLKCRLWWPKQLLSSKELSNSLLLGWFLTSSPASVDIIVAFACSHVLLSPAQSGLEDIICTTNEKMPIILQDKSTFSLLGQYADDMGSSSIMVGKKEDINKKLSSKGSACGQRRKRAHRENLDGLGCGCIKLDESVELYRQASVGNGNWVLLESSHNEQNGGGIYPIPRLHHVHWDGKTVHHCDVHVIIYETPSYGSHHFALYKLSSYNQVKTFFKEPKWVDELHRKQTLMDLNTVILAMNCAAAAKTVFKRYAFLDGSLAQCCIFSKFCVFMRHLLAIFLASISTLLYIALQLFHKLFHYGAESSILIALSKVFSTAWINILIRCSQILYWPVYLQKNDIRSQSCVEYAEKAVLHKHSIWSTLVVDMLLGNFIGLPLLYHAESVCSIVLNFAAEEANTFLRSGCVWLMGAPAGFKLNTELAGVLGMISLNAIQIWSTLGIFVGYIFHYILKGLALLGILGGLSIPVAFIIDMITLATLHVKTLHWLISLLYSSQIQAIAALWRLFRGRKWNPLRLRLDSFDYTVKQHIVGSLLFTPLLLLLPTTSVFYIFFCIVNTTINLICILMEVTISVIHATPFAKIFLRLVYPRRFPAGIWFESMCYWNNYDDCLEVDGANEINFSSEKPQLRKDTGRQQSSILVSVLHGNILSMGKVISPDYKKAFSGVSGTFISASAYGILTGKRMPSRLGTALPSPVPWISIPYKEYWSLCRHSVIACRGC